jgi:hypothetical protein
MRLQTLQLMQAYERNSWINHTVHVAMGTPRRQVNLSNTISKLECPPGDVQCSRHTARSVNKIEQKQHCISIQMNSRGKWG